eukprot:TRINITY_DN1292_c0_g2_i3.p1 TRINITY_DN1292_c0_g2~~TRINITY_DN1292_c0_g2_i3.p1  ORF type:complete len:1024 (+),score=224.20 TRINITY_DN1292_c0_g2_i3:30-3074(+)
MFVYLGLTIAALAGVLLFVFLTRKKVEEVYDKDFYQGKNTGFSKITADVLADFVKNRDIGWDWGTLGGNAKELAKALKTDLVRGLDSADFPDRRRHFGINKFKQVRAKPFFEFFIDTFDDRTLQILLVSAMVSIVLGVTFEDPSTGWIEGTAIFIAALVVSCVTAGNDYSKDQQFKKLSEINKNKMVDVTRNGRRELISVYDLLVGDLINIRTGDAIAADGIVATENELMVNESSLTGEVVPRKKGVKDPFMLSGCAVVSGTGTMIVISTGMNSEYGRLKSMIEREHDDTPLQVRLAEMADFVGYCGVGAASVTFCTLLGKWILERFVFTDLGWDMSQMHHLVEFVIIAITIIAVAVPEGLPLSVTISLAYSMTQMMADQNLVRHLAACETMGGATTICSDKTGTLTQNKMTVTECIVGTKEFTLDNLENFEHVLNDKLTYSLFINNIALNSSANITINEDGTKRISGAPTEAALLDLLAILKLDFAQIRETERKNVKSTYPFSSDKKRMSTVIQHGHDHILLVKGASEVILARCNHYLQSAESKKLGDSYRKLLGERIDEWAGRGLRTLSLAFKNLDKCPSKEVQDGSLDDDLTLIAICAIEDPIRPEVPKAVADCQRAGITVRMLTGDNILTAKDIARQCGILRQGGKCIEGPVFRNLQQNELAELVPNLQVMARCSPEDKLQLVRLLKERGEVVAVTGDGTNDAPQLTEADVGFAMGIAGTEVAKEASDIILLDDNFKSIMKAVLWGRNVYESIQKFIQFQLTVNVSAVAIAFIGAVTNGDTPLKAVQLLWVNLIMDTLAALALATDHPEDSILDRAPIGRSSPLITKKMSVKIIGQAIFQLSLLVGLLYSSASTLSFLGLEDDEGNHLRNTIIFNTFVFCQFFNEINCRRLEGANIFRGFFNNQLFVSILVASTFVQYLMVQYFGSFAETIPLNRSQWLFCVGAASLSIPWGLVLHSIPIEDETKKPAPIAPVVGSLREAKSKQLWQSVKTNARLLSVVRRARTERTNVA